MNTNDLYMEYARVIKMCEGTELEHETGKCVRWKWKSTDKWFYIEHQGHPNFNGFTITMVDVDFAVAVLEGRPVFVGDVIYDKQDEYVRKLVVSGINDYGLLINGSAIVWRSWKDNASWTPPPPKRTFTLNGVELPCPVRGLSPKNLNVGIISLDGFGEGFVFKSESDAKKVFNHLKNILEEARDKE